MKEIGLAIEGGLLIGCMFSLAAIFFGLAIYRTVRSWQIWKRKRAVGIMSAFALVAIIVGGTKLGTVSVSDPYIRDTGSFVTNDYVHVSIAKRFEFIPDDMEVLIWSRELSSTNASDWALQTRLEEGPYRLEEFPLDIQFPNATNYNFMVAANYIPQPTVHTNGVLSIKGFIIPNTNMSAFPNTMSTLIGGDDNNEDD